MAEILLNFDQNLIIPILAGAVTVKILQEKYFLQIFVNNGSYIRRKKDMINSKINEMCLNSSADSIFY